MFRCLLTLALSAQVACCPIFCGALSDARACSEESGARSMSFGHRSCRLAACAHARPMPSCPSCQTDPESDDSAPLSECPCQRQRYNCICSGAIVDKTRSDELASVQLFGWMTLPTKTLPICATTTPARFTHMEALPALGGRAVRALLCSLLC
jgi:hypothetical protein